MGPSRETAEHRHFKGQASRLPDLAPPPGASLRLRPAAETWGWAAPSSVQLSSELQTPPRSRCRCPGALRSRGPAGAQAATSHPWPGTHSAPGKGRTLRSPEQEVRARAVTAEAARGAEERAGGSRHPSRPCPPRPARLPFLQALRTAELVRAPPPQSGNPSAPVVPTPPPWRERPSGRLPGGIPLRSQGCRMVSWMICRLVV